MTEQPDAVPPVDAIADFTHEFGQRLNSVYWISDDGKEYLAEHVKDEIVQLSREIAESKRTRPLVMERTLVDAVKPLADAITSADNYAGVGIDSDYFSFRINGNEISIKQWRRIAVAYAACRRVMDEHPDAVPPVDLVERLERRAHSQIHFPGYEKLNHVIDIDCDEAATEIKRQRENERRWHVQIAENAGLRGDVAQLRAALEKARRQIAVSHAYDPYEIRQLLAEIDAALAPTQELLK
jgi:hypothetical protein